MYSKCTAFSRSETDLQWWYRDRRCLLRRSALAEAGLPDGRPATTHWALVDACRERYPQVDWKPERSVTESGGVFTGIDLSLYLVEKYCGHQVAVETAEALLLQTPKTWQKGYTVEAPEIAHDDEQIRKAQEQLFERFAK